MNVDEHGRALWARVYAYRRSALTIGLFGILGALYLLYIAPPPGLPLTSTLRISDGMSITHAARALEEANAIRSAPVFTFLVRVMNPSGVVAGMYSLTDVENAFSLAWRFSRGMTRMPSIKVTIPEGFTSREIALLLAEKLAPFDGEGFESRARAAEGYLFPDTYLFPPGTAPDAVIAAMRGNFEERLAPFSGEFAASGRSKEDVIIMASLLEKEARLTETRRMVSGILWKRLDEGIPLQVDAVFGYITGTTTHSPTFKELEIDSPYNTYRVKGLPPGPIANPGLDSINAALKPLASPYYYYLTGKDGTMYYAKTFEGHKVNRAKLR